MRWVSLYVYQTYPTYVRGVYLLHGSAEVKQHFVYYKHPGRSLGRSASDERILVREISKTGWR